MAIATLRPLAYASSPDMGPLPIDLYFSLRMTAVGDTDVVCVQAATDGKYITVTDASSMQTALDLYFEDQSAIPIGAVINSVTFGMLHKIDQTGGPAMDIARNIGSGIGWTVTTGGVAAYLPDFTNLVVPAAYATVETPVMTLNPVTSLPWTRAELFNDGNAGALGNGGFHNLGPAGSTTGTYFLDQIYLTVDYTAGVVDWYYNADTDHYSYSVDPGAPWVQSDPILAATSTGVSPTVTDGVECPLVDTDERFACEIVTPGVGCSTGGTSVLIEGTGFGNAATVKFGGSFATSVVIVDSHTITCITPAHADGVVDVLITNADTTTSTITGGFTYATPFWTQYLVFILNNNVVVFENTVQACTPPDNGVWDLRGATLPCTPVWWLHPTFHIYVLQCEQPDGSDNGDDPWTETTIPTDPDGWFSSPIAFGGSVAVIADGRPKDPRPWTSIATWTTASLGGSPAASVVFENHMVYAGGDYTPGTHYPPIRIFDGSFDHELCRLPPTTANVVPQAVISMLAANGTIYVSSHDTGTSSADWLGRVFSLDIDSGVMAPLGAAFAAGEMPYALAWHMGRLWCGTNNGIGTVGKVYYFRPGIDTVWVLDHSLATETAGGVDSLVSYGGLLYVGSDNAAAAFAKVLVRSALGVYTTSLTATGGVAALRNGFRAMRVFGTNLYATYWNADTPNISKIYKFDNASWTTAYTGASTTLRPFITLFESQEELFAIAGGSGLSGALVRTGDGTTWTNLTAQLPVTNTLLPIYGIEA
jgi:hypothetical protein